MKGPPARPGHGHHPSHSDGHGDQAGTPSTLRGGRALTAIVGLLVGLTVLGLVLLRPDHAGPPPGAPESGERVRGTVTAVAQIDCAADQLPGSASAAGSAGPPAPGAAVCVEVQVRLDEGSDAGVLVSQVSGDNATARSEVGDGVVLIRSPGQVPLAERYQLSDVQRGRPLAVLAALFAFAVVALGRWKGLRALAGLGISLVVLVTWLVPALLAGRPPILTAIVGAGAVMLVVLLLAHGPNVRTATAIVGTAASLLLTLGLASAFVQAASLSGVTSDEATYVQVLFGGLDLRGLLLAGIVIGALGILDDVTVTQVSTVYELRAANPVMPSRELYGAGLRVGRDHVASLVNTLLLAYAGASLPLVVIFTTSGEGLIGSLTNGVLAQEVVRTLVGSIGLVAAVPLTTALAAVMCPPVRAPDEVAPGNLT